MPIPPFDKHGLLPVGLLPVGVHDCTLDELKERFGSFRSNERRPKLFAKLQALFTEMRAARFGIYLLVDGSFVTVSDVPNDIDLVLVLPFAFDVKADLAPPQYNLASKRRVQARYGFDIITVRENTLEYEAAVQFFQQVRS